MREGEFDGPDDDEEDEGREDFIAGPPFSVFERERRHGQRPSK